MRNSNSVNEQSGSPRDSRNPGNMSGMTVGSQVVVGAVKSVDAKVIEGSHQGTFRAPNTGAGVTDQFKDQAGPRGETTNDPNAGA